MASIPITPVLDSESLALYVTEELDAFNEGQLKGDFFVPSPNPQRSNRLEKTVIRYGQRTLTDMQSCGKKWADFRRESFLGVAQVLAGDIRSVPNLDVEHTPRPKWEILHSDIIDWALDAAQYRRQAEKVAQKAVFHNG